MPRFVYLLPTFAVLVSILVGSGRADDPPKKAPTGPELLRQFQGTWLVESWEEGGKAVAEKELKGRGVFFGANVFILRRDGKVFAAGGMQLDPKKTPAVLNLVV